MNQEAQNKLTEHLSDRFWRLNNLYWVVNEKGQKVLFKLNRVQYLLYTALWYLNIVLKSRQHGVTTFFCIFFLDICLFNSNVRAGIIAHNREDAEAFFTDKVKFAYENLPDDLREARPASSDSVRELKFSNNSAIRVGTSMRSATLQYLHISEFGKICRKYPDKAREIVTGSLNTVHAGQFITIESTAEGNEGAFFDYCQTAEKKAHRGEDLTKLDFKFHFFPWWMDPRNRLDAPNVTIPKILQKYFSDLYASHGIETDHAQQVWYLKKWETQGSDMKREHPSTPGEAFEAAVEGAYFHAQFTRIYKEGRILPRIPVEDGVNVDTWWDLGMDDTTDIWFTQTHGMEIRLIDFYENSGEGIAHYVDVLDDRGYRYGTHTGPHDIEVRELGTGKSRKEVAQGLGLSFEVAPRLEKVDQIQAGRKILQYCYFDELKCAQGIKGLENYRKEWDDKNGCWKPRPLHDWASNPADAFLTMAVAHRFRTNTGAFRPNRRRAA